MHKRINAPQNSMKKEPINKKPILNDSGEADEDKLVLVMLNIVNAFFIKLGISMTDKKIFITPQILINIIA
ncbi:MAG: hypothetical protein L3J59_14085 [Methylococcaceae bacterium]|nr:hypothetical protein [Methylococcaceae bacterium]